MTLEERIQLCLGKLLFENLLLLHQLEEKRDKDIPKPSMNSQHVVAAKS